jgi:hypothetical protein
MTGILCKEMSVVTRPAWCHIPEDGILHQTYFSGRMSHLSIRYKIVVLNEIIKQVWIYRIQVWGCAGKASIQKIQNFQTIVLRAMINVPWYTHNSDFSRYLGIKMVTAKIKRAAKRHEDWLHQHTNMRLYSYSTMR